MKNLIGYFRLNKEALSQQIYGVIPFIAPEIICGDVSTRESDVYNFQHGHVST